MPEPDLSLTQRQVRAAQDGDRHALDDLVTRYLPRVRRIVASRMSRNLRDFADCEDIVQETFADAVRGIRGFSARSEGSFCDWLARCVENNVRDQLRRGRAQKRGSGLVRPLASLGETSLSESIFAGDEHPPSLAARTRETEERLEQALLSLDERYREVINLRVHCQMSYREIAEAMALPSENTANVLFLRARDKLGKLL